MMKQKATGFGFGAGTEAGHKLKTPKLPDAPSAHGALTRLTNALGKTKDSVFVDEDDMVEVCGFCNQTQCEHDHAPRKLVPRTQALD